MANPKKARATRERKMMWKMVSASIYRTMSDARIAAADSYDDTLINKLERIEGHAYAALSNIINGGSMKLYTILRKDIWILLAAIPDAQIQRAGSLWCDVFLTVEQAASLTIACVAVR
jgi:hypothetical protein